MIRDPYQAAGLSPWGLQPPILFRSREKVRPVALGNTSVPPMYPGAPVVAFAQSPA
jgi:hypothetical protein